MLDEELNAAKNNPCMARIVVWWDGTAYDHTIERLFKEKVKQGEGSNEKCAKKMQKRIE